MTDSRRRFFVAVLLFGAPLAAPGALFAAPPVAPDPYEAGVLLLKSGRWFGRAALRFNEAAKKDPNDFRVPLALGCAHASRAASLAHAAFFASGLKMYRQEYPKMLAEWETAQKNPEADNPGTPRPELPSPDSVFRTKDDNRPFRLTLNEADAQFAAQSAEANAAWDAAFALARTPPEQAEVEYTRGWGRRLLARHDKFLDFLRQMFAQIGSDSLVFTPKAPPKDAARRPKPLDDLVAATRDDPENALYWQSLGDAVGGYVGWIAETSPIGEGNIEGARVSVDDSNRAISAYQRALVLRPRDTALWYHLARKLMVDHLVQTLVTASEANGRGGAPPAPEPALDALRNAARSDAQNAYASYQIAWFGFKKVAYERVLGSGADQREEKLAEVAGAANEESRKTARAALSDIERGKRAGRYFVPVYSPAVPRLLQAAWNYGRYFEAVYHNADFSISGRLRELARAACGYALVSVREKKTGEAVRACRAVIGMGFVMAGNWPVEERAPGSGEVFTARNGSYVVAAGYDTLQQVYEQAGDREGAARAAAEHDTFRRRADAFQEVVKAKGHEDNGIALLFKTY